jgi:hypothetical protein
MNTSDNPNRSLVRIFSLSLGGLLFGYAAIAAYNLAVGEGVNTTDLSAGVLRIGLGLALGVLFCWGWLAEPFVRFRRQKRSGGDDAGCECLRIDRL